MTHQRSRVETNWKHWAPALASLLTVIGACAESGSRDGSQTHFAGSGGAANGDAPERTPEPNAAAAAPPSDSDDDAMVSSDDTMVSSDDAMVGSDDDSADVAGAADTSDDDTLADDDGTSTSDDDALDDDNPAPTTDDEEPAPTPTAADGTGGGPPTPDDCPDGNCDVNGQCSPQLVECTDVDAPDSPTSCSGKRCGDACSTCDAADSDCAAAEGTCNSRGECSTTADICSVERPLCSATTFESTNDGCVEESWVWDGGDCVTVEHCGCATGDCERLYPDAESCQSAHAACLPSACIAQDAQSSGNMCGTLDGYAYDGATCTAIICGCRGEDCDDYEPTEEDCQSRFAMCLTRTPQCIRTLFPLEEVTPGYDPAYPPFGFSVEGYDELYDAESQTVAVFADWTPARYGGLEEVFDATTCPPIGPLRFSFNCPAPRPLLFEVDGEILRVNLTLHWDSGFEIELPTDVEMRISPHPTGTLVLQIRDTEAVPVLMVVNERTDMAGADGVWDFPPFTFAAAEQARCTTPADNCDWTFSALNLEVTTADQERVLVPSERADFEVDGINFAALHGYIFKQSKATPDACATTYPWRQNFALVRAVPQ